MQRLIPVVNWNKRHNKTFVLTFRALWCRTPAVHLPCITLLQSDEDLPMVSVQGVSSGTHCGGHIDRISPELHANAQVAAEAPNQGQRACSELCKN
jgi:hypothetical protein